MTGDPVQVAAGRVAAAKRWGTTDLAEAEQALREARAEKAVLTAVRDLPIEARRRLAALLTEELL